MSVLYTRAPRLFADLAIPDGDVCCVRYAVGNDCYLRLPPVRTANFEGQLRADSDEKPRFEPAAPGRERD
jgi:hypothetical protein